MKISCKKIGFSVWGKYFFFSCMCNDSKALNGAGEISFLPKQFFHPSKSVTGTVLTAVPVTIS